jgi:hypothetical protein
MLWLGRFDTEYDIDIMMCGDMRKAYIKADLFDPSQGNASVDDLLRRYVVEMLWRVPGSTHQFSNSLTTASAVLHNVLLNEEIVFGTPAVFFSHIV